jgi:hypothetical protein
MKETYHINYYMIGYLIVCERLKEGEKDNGMQAEIRDW